MLGLKRRDTTKETTTAQRYYPDVDDDGRVDRPVATDASGADEPRGGGRGRYELTRALTTLLAAGVAGFLLWLASQIGESTNGDYWAVYGIVAGAGLVMAFSQLVGGWTKWGWPRLSVPVFLLAFVPALIVGGWTIAAHQPDGSWLQSHVVNWTGDIGLTNVVTDLKDYVAVIAFGLGLLLGFSFDTTGPRRVVRASGRGATAVETTPYEGRADADEPTAAETRYESAAEERDEASSRTRVPH
jgi:hypothetical protein